MATVAQPIQVATFRGVRASRRAGSAGFYVLLTVLSIVSMFPFAWTFVSSGKAVSEL
jgi:hypothetical protein